VIQLSDEGLLFVLSESDLACLRAVYVGHERATVTTSPTLLSRHLVVVENRASNSSMLHVLTLDDGGLPETVVQTIEVASQILSQPVVLSGKLLAVTTGGRVLAWESASEPQSGLTEVAKTDLGTAQDKSPTSLARFPLVASDELLVAGQGLRLLAPPANGTLKPVWSALADDTLLSQPYHSGETIVTLRRTTAGGGILAAGVSAADGKVHWETRLGERIVRLEFSSGGGNARAVTAGGASAEFSVADLKGQHTAALSPASPTKSATSTVPAKRLAWRDGLVLISASGEVTYVDAASGALKADPLQLRLQPGQRLDRCDAAPVGEGGMKLAVSDGHAMLLLLDLAGEGGPQIVELASAKLAAAPTSGLIVGDNLVGLIDRRGQLATFSLSDLSLGAAIDIGTGAVLAGPTRVGELTILATGRAELVALDRGLAIAWRVPFGRGLPAGDLLSAEGKLLLACRSGRLCVHDGKTGQELAASDLGEPLAGTPLVVGGQVLVPTAAGAVLHVEIPVPREAAP
jgi:outer membrane protein assembly factor BamB